MTDLKVSGRFYFTVQKLIRSGAAVLGSARYPSPVSKRLISSGSEFEQVAGYSRAVVDGDYVHVSGTTGFNYEVMEISDDPAVQARQCFANIANALEQADVSFDDVVRVVYYLREPQLFTELAPIFGEFLGTARPAATAVGVQMVDPKIAIEIEVTAKCR